MSTTYYDVLGVDADASQETIRDAYREKVKEYHPDVSDHPDAEERFKRVKRAEIVLADPEERDTYDRLGHEAYVNGDDPASNRPTEDEVRWAAARAAQGAHDAGGRSAGWRERERRSRRTGRAEWFRDDEATADPFDDLFADVGTGPASGRDGSATAESDAARSTASDGSTSHVADRTAADGWGGTSAESTGHAVHDWGPERRTVSVPRPGWTQDDVVLLASSLFLYPILLFLTVSQVFPTVANVAIGVVTIALVAFLLPRPAFGLPVFGTWSILVPGFLLALEIPLWSAFGIVALGGTWLPLLYSIAVAMALAR